MVNIFEIPLYYISFSPNSMIEKHYQHHGFKNVNHFEAVNGKKMDIKKLLDDGVVSIRVYDDLVKGRVTHEGMPSMGGIGCTLSHYELWEKCVKENLPYIIIAEEDNRIPRKITTKDEYRINNIISQDCGVFISTKISKEKQVHFFGTHFCILSNKACQKLIRKCFPIDVQTDGYMAHLATIGDINLDGYVLSAQYPDYYDSSIQTFCLTCFLPRNQWFYIILIILILFLGLCSFKR